MKKLFYAFILMVTALAATSCIGPTGPAGKDGRDGMDGKDGVVNYYNIPVQINQNEWSYLNADNNNYFFAVINMPEITWDIYEHANVMVYREYDHGTTNATQTPLPYVRHKEYQADAANNVWGFYTETVDYEYTQGKLTIFYTASDFDYEIDLNFVPEAMQFRVFIMF